MSDNGLPGCPHCRDRLIYALTDDYECSICGAVWRSDSGAIYKPEADTDA